jgi:hypothetical protein
MFSIYKEQIDKWHDSIQKGNLSKDYLQHFLKEIVSSANLEITMDDRVAVLIRFLLLH